MTLNNIRPRIINYYQVNR